MREELIDILAEHGVAGSMGQDPEKALDELIKRLDVPTNAMINAAAYRAKEVGSSDFVAIWRAMLKAAVSE